MQEQPPIPPNKDESLTQQNVVYEMLWDCRYCGSTQLLAKTYRFCPHCGAPQNADTRYFPNEQQKTAVQQHVYVGADKICSACQALNAGNAEFCGQCGAPLTEAARAKLQTSQPSHLSSTDKVEPHSLASLNSVNPSKQDSGSKNRYKILFIIIAIVIIGGAIAFFWTKPLTVEVIAHRWEYEIKIENFAPRMKNDWCDQIPTDSYKISRTSKIRSQRQIADGEECHHQNVDQGDGTFRQEQVCKTKYRAEPIYADFCTYTVDRWEYARSVKTDSRDHYPFWPEFQLAAQEREGSRLAVYYLIFINHKDNEEFECAVNEPLWQTTELKSQWSLKVGVLTGSERCNTLQPLFAP